MTLPDERTLAVRNTKQFLLALASGEIKRIPKAVRMQARSLLKHYPGEFDMKRVVDVLPEIFGDPNIPFHMKEQK